MLERYADVGVEDMRANLVAFVREIAAVAEEEGARLAIHPGDPAFPIFGLPRVLSTAEDVRKLFEAVRSEACGLTLCAGSFGSNPANDLFAMASSGRACISSTCATSSARRTDHSMRPIISAAIRTSSRSSRS